MLDRKQSISNIQPPKGRQKIICSLLENVNKPEVWLEKIFSKLDYEAFISISSPDLINYYSKNINLRSRTFRFGFIQFFLRVKIHKIMIQRLR